MLRQRLLLAGMAGLALAMQPLATRLRGSLDFNGLCEPAPGLLTKRARIVMFGPQLELANHDHFLSSVGFA